MILGGSNLDRSTGSRAPLPLRAHRALLTDGPILTERDCTSWARFLGPFQISACPQALGVDASQWPQRLWMGGGAAGTG